MSLYEFVPVESHGMSVITLLVLVIFTTFAGVGITVTLKWIVEKFHEQNEMIKDVDERVDRCVGEIKDEMSDGKVQFAEIKGTIGQTKIMIDNIDKSVSTLLERT